MSEVVTDYDYDDYSSTGEEDLYPSSGKDLNLVALYQRQINSIPIHKAPGSLPEESTVGLGRPTVEVREAESKIAELSPEEERLVVGHLRLAAHVARLTMGWVPKGSGRVKADGTSVFKGAVFKDLSMFASSPLPLADRIQAANEGLIRAAQKYKNNRGAAFTTYAMYWIEQAISRAIAEDRNLAIPVNVQEDLRKVTANPEAARLLHFPSLEMHLGERQATDQRRIVEVLKTITEHTVSLEQLDEQISEGADYQDEPAEDGPVYLTETLAGDEQIPEELALGSIRKELLWKTLREMPDREAFVLIKRNELDGDDAWALERLGHHFDVTRERIRQIEHTAYGRFIGLAAVAELSDDDPEAARQKVTEERLKFIDGKLKEAKARAIVAIYGNNTEVEPQKLQAAKAEIMRIHSLYLFVKKLYALGPEKMLEVERQWGGLFEERFDRLTPEDDNLVNDVGLLKNMHALLPKNPPDMSTPANFQEWLTDLVKKSRHLTAQRRQLVFYRKST